MSQYKRFSYITRVIFTYKFKSRCARKTMFNVINVHTNNLCNVILSYFMRE